MGEIVRLQTKSSAKNKKTIVVTVLAIVTLVVLFAVNSVSPIIKTTGKRKSVSLQLNNTSYLLGKNAQNAVVCNDQEIHGISADGKSIWRVKLKYSKPFIKTSDNFTAVADIGGRECKIISDGKEKSLCQTDDEIITVAVNKSGHYAVVTREKGYRSKVSVFDLSGKQIYAWHTADYDVIDVALSNDNRQMAVAALGCNGEKNLSSVFIFDFNSEKHKTCYEGNTNLVSGIYYSGQNIICIGDKAAYSFSPGATKAWELDYNGRTLQEFAFDDSSILAMGFTKSSMDSLRGGSVIEIYAASGRLRGTYETQNAIGSIDVDGKSVFVNTEDKTVVVNNNGNVLATLPVTHIARDSVMFGDNVLIPSGDTLELYEY